MNKIDDKYIQNVIDDISIDNFLEKVNDNIYLRPNEIAILKMNNIDYKSCNTLNSLIYLVEELLDEEYDENLDYLSKELSERNYYQNTNK